MQKIIIVEDDRSLNLGLCQALKTEGREIFSCLSISQAEALLLETIPALIILDINLPDGSGLDFLKQVKANYPHLPIILLTANDTDLDIVNGLELGADDYITKPFSLSVLRARVNTQLRRCGTKIVEGKFCFDFDNMQFQVDGKSVELSKSEQKLLYLLIQRKGSPVNRNYLIDRIWTDGDEYVDENALSVTIKRLRSKLKDNECIQTVYGIGYMWREV